MKLNLFSNLLLVFCVTNCFSKAQELSAFVPEVPKPICPDDPKGRELPPGVPRVVDTNGNVIFINRRFTTRQYQQAAIKLVLQEANTVAGELQLPEKLPIAESNLTEAIITPFGYNYINKKIGSISTTNYVYYVSQGDKFNGLDVADYDQTCSSLEEQLLPIKQMDTDGAYQLATQWLAAVSMDVKGLNRDCKTHVALSPYWNGLDRLGQKPRKNFVPIYFVWWTSPKNDTEGYGDVACVEFFSPTKKILQLTVRDSKYILRKPLVFTNLDSLFPGTAPITVFTNFPVNTRILKTVP
jgi:hypothetical protein